eukprot:74647-Ditylum_brightwellii.AAC.1
MMSLPFLFGFTPLRWRKAIDVMLEKIPGKPKITKLQIIVIVEGDMNGMMKVIWNQHLVPCAKKNNKLSKVQFDNRKERILIDALLLKVITMDSVRLFCLSGALLNNNTVACYNRMMPEVTSIHLQSLGLPAPAARCSVKLNQDMKHHIKTYTGVSHELYSHLSHRPKYGEGQGKTSSSSNWLFTSCSLLADLHGLCSEIYLSSVCGRFTSQ